jgi:DNA-binding NtrC family response regulator
MKQKQGRILVVDDLRDWRNTFETILKNEGYTVVTAANFDKASSLLGKQSFDVAIIDIRLKDWDVKDQKGMELLNKIDPKLGTQVIIMTAYPTVKTERDAFKEYQVFDYLEKTEWDPVRFRRLVRDAVRVAYKKRGETLAEL